MNTWTQGGGYGHGHLGTLTGMLTDCSSSNRVSPTLTCLCVRLSLLTLTNCTLSQSHKNNSPLTLGSSDSKVSVPSVHLASSQMCWNPHETIHPKGTGPCSSPEAKGPATLSVSGYFVTPEHPEDLSPIYGSFLLTWISHFTSSTLHSFQSLKVSPDIKHIYSHLILLQWQCESFQAIKPALLISIILYAMPC